MGRSRTGDTIAHSCSDNHWPNRDHGRLKYGNRSARTRSIGRCRMKSRRLDARQALSQDISQPGLANPGNL